MGQWNSTKRQVEEWPDDVPPDVRERLKAMFGRTLFDRNELCVLWRVYASQSTPPGSQPLDKARFQRSLALIGESCLTSFRLQETPFGERLFTLLASPSSGCIDFDSFAMGLSQLCKGSPAERTDLSFRAYDLDGSGFIQREELQDMFKSAWLAGLRFLAATHGGAATQEELGDVEVLADEMAQMLADNALQELDTNGDGVLSLEEFRLFALSEPRITVTLAGFSKEFSIIWS